MSIYIGVPHRQQTKILRLWLDREMDAKQLQAQQAAQEGRPYETSFYLGFAPDAVLAHCAEQMRKLGKRADAQRAEDLALEYCEDQVRTINELMQGQRTFAGTCPRAAPP